MHPVAKLPIHLLTSESILIRKVFFRNLTRITLAYLYLLPLIRKTEIFLLLANSWRYFQKNKNVNSHFLLSWISSCSRSFQTVFICKLEISGSRVQYKQMLTPMARVEHITGPRTWCRIATDVNNIGYSRAYKNLQQQQNHTNGVTPFSLPGKRKGLNENWRKPEKAFQMRTGRFNLAHVIQFWCDLWTATQFHRNLVVYSTI
jgi:hypothetical protein